MPKIDTYHAIMVCNREMTQSERIQKENRISNAFKKATFVRITESAINLSVRSIKNPYEIDIHGLDSYDFVTVSRALTKARSGCKIITP